MGCSGKRGGRLEVEVGKEKRGRSLEGAIVICFGVVMRCDCYRREKMYEMLSKTLQCRVCGGA
jgi:hypothetical protein